MRRGLLSEATEGLQPKFRRGKSTSLILEDSGDYQQTLREKYTGHKSHAFRRSLVNGRREQSGYASSDSESDSDSDKVQAGKGIPGGFASVGVHQATRDTHSSDSGGSEAAKGISPAVSPVAVASSSVSVNSSLSSPFAPAPSRQFSQNPVFNTKSMGMVNKASSGIGMMSLMSQRNSSGSGGGTSSNSNAFHSSSLYNGKGKASQSHQAKKASEHLSSSPQTPSLKAAMLEEEELMLTEEKDKQINAKRTRPAGAAAAAGGGAGSYTNNLQLSGDRGALDDLRSGSDPTSTSGSISTGTTAGRKLFGEATTEETVLARARPLQQGKGGQGARDNHRHPNQGGRPGGNGSLLRSSSFDLHALMRDRKLESFLRPCSTREMLKCRMTRKRGLVGSYPVFEMHLDIQGLSEDKSFLLCARKRKKSKSSYYIISLQRDGLTRESEGYIAKLRGNLLGSEYTLYRRSGDKGEVGQLDGGDELMVVKYKQTLLTKEGGPREMTAIFTDPAFDAHCNSKKDLLKHYSQGKEAMKAKLEQGQGGSSHQDYYKNYDNSGSVGSLLDEEASLTSSLTTSGGRREDELVSTNPPLTILRSVEPQWRDDLQCYVLDFKGRVTEASVKNFVMEKGALVKSKVDKKDNGSGGGGGGGNSNSNHSNGGDRSEAPQRRVNRTREIVIFGKRGKNEFALDVASPCSILQAFALAIASTDFKMVNSM